LKPPWHSTSCIGALALEFAAILDFVC